MRDLVLRVTYENVVTDLDIDSNIPLRLDISAFDNSRIGVLFGVGSQTFDLPGTKKNNIFFKNAAGELHTPTPDSFLDGITRRCVIEIAKSKGIKVIERKIGLNEISDFVGCFLTGTAAEVTPVSCIDKYNFKVCTVIADLADSYQGLVRRKKNAA